MQRKDENVWILNQGWFKSKNPQEEWPFIG